MSHDEKAATAMATEHHEAMGEHHDKNRVEVIHADGGSLKPAAHPEHG